MRGRHVGGQGPPRQQCGVEAVVVDRHRGDPDALGRERGPGLGVARVLQRHRGADQAEGRGQGTQRGADARDDEQVVGRDGDAAAAAQVLGQHPAQAGVRWSGIRRRSPAPPSRRCARPGARRPGRPRRCRGGPAAGPTGPARRCPVRGRCPCGWGCARGSRLRPRPPGRPHERRPHPTRPGSRRSRPRRARRTRRRPARARGRATARGRGSRGGRRRAVAGPRAALRRRRRRSGGAAGPARRARRGRGRRSGRRAASSDHTGPAKRTATGSRQGPVGAVDWPSGGFRAGSCRRPGEPVTPLSGGRERMTR